MSQALPAFETVAAFAMPANAFITSGADPRRLRRRVLKSVVCCGQLVIDFALWFADTAYPVARLAGIAMDQGGRRRPIAIMRPMPMIWVVPIEPLETQWPISLPCRPRSAAR